MHIIYAGTVCSEKAYREVFANSKEKPAIQAQKYHRLFAAGLASWCKVDVVSALPISSRDLSERRLKRADETEDGIRFHYLSVYRNRVSKLINQLLGTFFTVLGFIRKDSVIIIDCLNHTASLSALAAARMCGKRCVGIVTDIPEVLGDKGFGLKIANFLIKHCTDYVLLTEEMNARINNKHKPYVVLEGHSDVRMREKVPDLGKKSKPRECIYAGGISRQYGLDNLVQGFIKADIPNTVLKIFGYGDYVQDLKKIADKNPTVSYGGMLFNEEIVDIEMKASLLINPRPTNEEFVKYSFPSKTMEYMSTGTPVLTTCLPGIPKEYEPYLFFIRDESPEGIAAALHDTLSKSDEALFEKGLQAREFILSERNNCQQAGRLLQILNA